MNLDELSNHFEQITAHSDVMWSSCVINMQVNVMSWIGLHHSSQMLEMQHNFLHPIQFNVFKYTIICAY